MEILFIDESKPPTDRDKINSSNKLFVLSGLIIPDYSWKEINNTFNSFLNLFKVKGEIKWRYFAPQNKDKGNPLLHLTQTEKNGLRTAMLKMLGKRTDIKVISVICDLEKAYANTYYINNKTDVYDYCYKKLVERFQYYLQDKSKQAHRECVGIIVCDHRGRQDDIHLRQMHEKVLRKGEEYCSNILNIIETVFFVPSEKSTGIQLVDIIAGSIFRYVSSKDDNFYRHIKSIVRRNSEGKAEGYGIVFVPPRK